MDAHHKPRHDKGVVLDFYIVDKNVMASSLSIYKTI